MTDNLFYRRKQTKQRSTIETVSAISATSCLKGFLSVFSVSLWLILLRRKCV
jgi:hypothetical protein